MSTKYPTDFDDGVTLGPTFIDVAPPTDPQRNIAAEYRNNVRDAIIAVQTRVGKTDDPSTSSIDWGLLSVSGSPNQGVRFAGTHALWPGVVAENGIFIDSGSGNVSFHKSGDPVGTFTDLTSGSVVPTWNQIYAGASTLDVSGATLAFTQTSTAGYGFSVERNLAAASTGAPIVGINNLNAGDDQQALAVTSTGGPTFAAALGGAPAATVAIASSTAFITGALGALSDVRCFAADIIPNAGDNAAAVYRGFAAAGSGTGAAVKQGFYADTNWDFGIHCGSRVYLTDGSVTTTTSPYAIPFMLDSDPATFLPSSVICNAGTNNSVFMLMSEGIIDNLATTNINRFTFTKNGVLNINTDDVNDALTIEQSNAPTTSRLCRMNDGFASAPRVSIERTGKTAFTPNVDVSGVSSFALLNTWSTNGDGIILEVGDAGNAYLQVYNDGYTKLSTNFSTVEPVLSIDQLNATYPLMKYGGTEGATQTASISNVQGDSGVVGPLAKVGTSGWAFGKMIKIDVNGTPYYLCAYVVAP